MAATRLIPLHVNKGRSVAACLEARTDYAKNPEKTEKGDLVTSYECDPMTVDEEFMLSKRKYQQITGLSPKNDIIAYQIRQSFRPGEITAEEANRAGYELAMRFTKGRYAFIVATHTDRATSTTTSFSIRHHWTGQGNSETSTFLLLLCNALVT